MFQHSQFKPSLSTQQSQKVLQYLLKEKVEPYGDMNQLILEHGLLNTTKEERNKAKSKELALQNQKRGKLFGSKLRSSLKSTSPLKKKEDHLSLKKLFSQFIQDLQQTDKANDARREQRAVQIKKAIQTELAKFVPQKKKNQIQALVQSKYGKNFTVKSGAEREKKIHGAQIIKEAGGKISALQSRTSKVPTQEPSPSKGKVTFIENETEQGRTEVTIQIKKEESTTAEHFQKFLQKKNIRTHLQDEDNSVIKSKEFQNQRILITEEDSLEEGTVTREMKPTEENLDIQITSENQDENVKRETTPQRVLKSVRVQQLMERPKYLKKKKDSRVNQSVTFIKPTKNPYQNLPIASVNRITELKKRSGSPLTKSFSQKPKSIKPSSPSDIYQFRPSSKRPNTSGIAKRTRTEPNDTSYSHFKIAAIKSRQSTEQSNTTFQQDSSFLKRGNISRFSQISAQSSYHFSSKHNPKKHGESFIIKGLQSNKNIRENMFSVSDIISKCDKSMAGEIEELKKQNIRDQSEELKHFTNNIQRVVNNYMEMSHLNDKELQNRTLENMFKEVVLNDAFDHQNFTSQEELDKHRLDSKKCTMFIKHLGRRQLWKPDRFVMSRKVRVAQNFEDLQRE